MRDDVAVLRLVVGRVRRCCALPSTAQRELALLPLVLGRRGTCRRSATRLLGRSTRARPTSVDRESDDTVPAAVVDEPAEGGVVARLVARRTGGCGSGRRRGSGCRRWTLAVVGRAARTAGAVGSHSPQMFDAEVGVPVVADRRGRSARGGLRPGVSLEPRRGRRARRRRRRSRPIATVHTIDPPRCASAADPGADPGAVVLAGLWPWREPGYPLTAGRFGPRPSARAAIATTARGPRGTPPAGSSSSRRGPVPPLGRVLVRATGGARRSIRYGRRARLAPCTWHRRARRARSRSASRPAPSRRHRSTSSKNMKKRSSQPPIRSSASRRSQIAAPEIHSTSRGAVRVGVELAVASG